MLVKQGIKLLPPLNERRMAFFAILFLMSMILFFSVGLINSGLDMIFSKYSLIISNTTVDKLGLIIAPIIEETFKLIGYSMIFLIDFNKRFVLRYRRRPDYLRDNLLVAFLLSAGGFGLLEGLFHNSVINFPFCFASFIILNMLIHITYSIYPIVLSKKYHRNFIMFLPVAISLHSVHNFIIRYIWDNKWITFSMVTIFMLPLLFVYKKNLFDFIKRFNLVRKLNDHCISSLFILVYMYILLCCLLAFI